MTAPYPTEREGWLAQAVTLLAPMFIEASETLPLPEYGNLPAVRVACGWPSRNARPSKRQRIGECWAGVAAEDGVPQIFISPMLRDTGKVLATLLHELAHAAVGTEVGHKGPFARLAKRLGLLGKPTATYADDALIARLNGLVVPEIGEYPHAALTIVQSERKQTTRLIKAECPDCGCIIRITRKWIDEVEHGLVCPMSMESSHENYMEVAA